ncbi:MAG: YceI family protein [Pseudomonadota bacterium]
MNNTFSSTIIAATAIGLSFAPGALVAADAKVAVAAPSGSYANDPTHTSLHWKIGHIGLSNYTARMSDVAITLDFNADKIERSSLKASIGAASVDTGYPGDKDFDAEVSGDMILKSAANPAIEFVSTKIKQTGPSTADITGDLTLAGVTKPVTLQAVYQGSLEAHPFAKVPAIGFSATGEIDRTDFGVDFLSGKGLADTVAIEIQAEFIKQ